MSTTDRLLAEILAEIRLSKFGCACCKKLLVDGSCPVAEFCPDCTRVARNHPSIEIIKERVRERASWKATVAAAFTNDVNPLFSRGNEHAGISLPHRGEQFIVREDLIEIRNAIAALENVPQEKRQQVVALFCFLCWAALETHELDSKGYQTTCGACLQKEADGAASRSGEDRKD